MLCIHVCIHTYIQTYKHTNRHTQHILSLFIYIHTYMHTYIHTCVYAYIYICVYILLHLFEYRLTTKNHRAPRYPQPYAPPHHQNEDRAVLVPGSSGAYLGHILGEVMGSMIEAEILRHELFRATLHQLYQRAAAAILQRGRVREPAGLRLQARGLIITTWMLPYS